MNQFTRIANLLDDVGCSEVGHTLKSTQTDNTELEDGDEQFEENNVKVTDIKGMSQIPD